METRCGRPSDHDYCQARCPARERRVSRRQSAGV